ncbi:hypothetical protein R1sor_012309 [Riccia sorocarpa]|uniref:Uncharacterized protein n=1 Tax=Riccia sorocarpa TaxID=122646 RepID=A0ABD3I3F0_9MARC
MFVSDPDISDGSTAGLSSRWMYDDMPLDELEGFQVEGHEAMPKGAVAEGDLLGLGRRLVSPLGREVPMTSSSCEVFKLLDVRSDTQDLAIVEKVIPPEQNIYALCDILVPRSTKKVDGQMAVDFDQLDSVSRSIVGFYGSK